MVDSGEADTSEPNEPPKKGFDISSLAGPVTEVDTAIGKLFLFPLRSSDISAFNNIASKEPVNRIRKFLPLIASLSSDGSLEKEHQGVTHDQVQSLSDESVEELAEAYALSDALLSARDGGEDRDPVARDVNESATAFLDRLLRSEVEERRDRYSKLANQILGPTQGLFDQVRNSSAILGSTLTEFEQLAKGTMFGETHTPSMDHFQIMNDLHARKARERAEELETVRLTGKMTVESAKALKELVDAAATLMEQMDERDQKTDRTTRKQITIAVWALGISALLALLALIVSGFGYLQDRGSIISGTQWQAEILAVIQQETEQRSATERENQGLREQMKSLESRIADLEAAERTTVDTSKETVPE